MPHYTAPDGSLHYLSEADIAVNGESYLPAGSVRFTAEEELAFTQAQVTQRLEAMFTSLIQQRLDNFAHERNYDGILSACTYAASSVEKFRIEGLTCVKARDDTWAAGYQILTAVQAGHRAVPASLADIEADLPVLAWP